MRWWVLVCALLLASPSVNSDAEPQVYNASVTTAVSVSVLGLEDATLALQELAVIALEQAGVVALPAPALQACRLPDDPACLKATIQALQRDTITAAVVAVPASPAASLPTAWALRESGIEELGEVSSPTRRACLATKTPARSLLDLADDVVAATYHVPEEDVQNLVQTCESPNCSKAALMPSWCRDVRCATILTGQVEEAQVLWREVNTYRLYATILALGNQLPKVAKALSTRPIIACDWALDLTPLNEIQAQILGPPPCLNSQPCPFETRRLVKFVNIRELARAPSAVRAFARLSLSKDNITKLAQEAAAQGPKQAAMNFWKHQPISSRTREVRVAVLLPKTTNREAFNSRALYAAAVLAEIDLEKELLPSIARFKVVAFDDECHTAGAYKQFASELWSTEFGALSALAGPACGAAWTDMARHSLNYHLPVLAYTPQSPASVPHDGKDTRLQLLAAGDARDAASALTSLLERFGWRRVAALSEPATRTLLDALRLYAKLDVHMEIPDAGQNVSVDRSIIQNWTSRAATENARIIYLCVEDAHIARSALCAARAQGLTPANGAVWLLCLTHSPTWLEAGPGENCTTEQIKEVAEGHFTVSPEWATRWQNNTIKPSGERLSWESRWQKQCRFAWTSSDSTSCDAGLVPHAALLYDMIRQWALALFRVLQQNSNVVDDLHNVDFVRSLIDNTTKTEFTGLTGYFQWSTVEGAYIRNSSMIISQWNSKLGVQKVGTWSKGSVEINTSAIRWYTPEGHVPDDGSEICGLQGLADALHTDCRTTFFALGAFLIGILVAALAATALYCKRRSEKEYRKHLLALGMRPLPIKPAGHDRWEIPRERVVINRKLGTGAFGTVYGGHALLTEDRGWSAVAVKTLKAGASTEEKLDFLSEAEAMKRFDHKNVVRLLGIVTKTEPVCTVMEFMLYGDLKNYLLARRHLATGGGEEETEGQEADEASPRRLTGMALDVARALSYLAQLRYVHRDVAARNCLVSARRVVKLADFGMTRLVFENDYYRFSRKGMLPVRWMAPESLALGVFSPASDVWSFGVLLYEIVTFGSLPFQGLSNSEVLAQVKGGHTLDLPPGLKPQLEGLIKSCWQQDPKVRPTASEVAAFLADAPRLLAPCLDVPLDALPLEGDPPWRLPRDQAEARWVSWAAPASAATDTTYLSTDGALPLDTDTFLP